MLLVVVFKNNAKIDEFLRKYNIDKKDVKKIDDNIILVDVERRIPVVIDDFKKFLWAIMEFDKLKEYDKKYLMSKIKAH